MICRMTRQPHLAYVNAQPGTLEGLQMRRSLPGIVAVLLWASSIRAAGLPEIRLNAVIEAPAARVWPLVATGQGVSKWLFRQANSWAPQVGQSYRVLAPGDQALAGEFKRVEANRRIEVSWPTPPTSLTLEIRVLDPRHTLITLVHSGWPDETADIKHQYEDMTARWCVALMKLHRQFPPPDPTAPVVRPADAKGLFIDRSLILNGDFEEKAPGRYEGVGYGWETNTAKPSPKVHGLDEKVVHSGKRSQRIAHPQDWTNFAVQQFTPHVEPMISPGKRYRLTGWVKAEGIASPAGWYKLGLWFIDMGGKPIGDSIKNQKRVGPDGKTIVNHDWRQYTIEAVAPKGAARAVVIFSGHWDQSGTVWYDDVKLWEAQGSLVVPAGTK